jgi:hypothetical protein
MTQETLDLHRKSVVVLPVFNYVSRDEDVLGSGGIAPCILNLCTRQRSVVSFTPTSPGRVLPQGISPPYPSDRRLHGPQS